MRDIKLLLVSTALFLTVCTTYALDEMKVTQLSDLVLVPQVGNTSPVKNITAAKDGSFALTLAGQIKIWDLRTRKEVRTLSQPSGIAKMALLPDCKSVIVSPIAAASATREKPGDTLLRQYDLNTGKVIREYSGNTWGSASVSVNDDGTKVISSIDKSVRIWNIQDGTTAAVFTVENGGRALALNKQGTSAAVSIYKEGMVELWDILNRRKTAVLTDSDQSARISELDKIAFSNDGKLLFGCRQVYNQSVKAYDHIIYVWETDTGRLRTRTAIQSTSNKTQNFVDFDYVSSRFIIIKNSGKLTEVYDPVSDTLKSYETASLIHDEQNGIRVSAAALLPDYTGAIFSLSEGKSSWGHTLSTVHFDTPELVNPMHPSLDVYSETAADPKHRYVLAWNDETADPVLWNMETGRLEARIPLPSKQKIICSAVTPDQRRIYIAAGTSLYTWDVEKRTLAKTVTIEGTPLTMIPIANDILCCTYIRSEYGSGGSYFICRIDGESGKTIIKSFKSWSSADGLALSPDGSRLSFSAGFKMPIIETKTLDLIKEIDLGTEYAFNPSFLADGITVVGQSRGRFRFIDTNTGSITHSPYTFSGKVLHSSRSPFFREIRYPDKNDPTNITVHFRQISDGAEIDRSRVPSDDPIADPHFYATAEKGGLIRHNLITGSSVVCISDKNTGSWAVYDQNGFWDGSENSGEIMAMARRNGGTDSFQIDQFAVRNNRPDKILESLDSTNSELIAHYRSMYVKRLKKLGIDESSLEKTMRVPGTELVAQRRKDSSIQLDMRFFSQDSPLSTYQIFVNNVPLFGPSGRSFADNTNSGKRAQNDAAVTHEIFLTLGTNKIEFSCTNEWGIESFRYPVFAFQPKKNDTIKPNLYFLGFGVSDYADPEIRDLKYAEKDAADLESLFKSMQGGKYEKVFTKTILGRDVTRASIAAAHSFLKNASVNDMLVLFISGHGIQYGKNPVYYYITGDTVLSDLEKTAAPFDLIESLLHDIAPRQKFFLMDTCESGEADESSSTLPKTASSKGLYARTLGIESSRGLSVLGKNVSHALSERDRFIYNDLLRRSGTIVFSSSRGSEASLESDMLKQGLFTYSILKALKSKTLSDTDKNGTISVRELRAFVENDVPRLAESISPGAFQHPVVDRDNLFADFGF